MLPFDLERALRGEKVITRDGEEVKDLHWLNSADRFPLVGVVDGQVHNWAVSGAYFTARPGSCLDLFMPCKKRTIWVNFYHQGLPPTHGWYESQADADNMAGPNRIGDKAYPVEIDGD